MLLQCLLLAVLAGQALVEASCPKINSIARSLRDDYCDQPLFINFLPKYEESKLLDNVCLTLFPLPDDPSTFQIYASIVYCDASYEVISFIATDIQQGVIRAANPFNTITGTTFGYAGCDTYLLNGCSVFGSERLNFVIGLSSSCAPIGLSCLRKIEEIVSDNCLPDQEFYVLPMKLPNKCVSQRQCISTVQNQFYKAVGLGGPLLY